VPGAVADEGLTSGAGCFSPRSLLFFAGGVAPGGIGDAFSRRLSFPLSLSGVSAGLADAAGAVVAAGLAGAAGLAAAVGVEPGPAPAGEAPAGLCAASAFSRGLMVGGGMFLGSSLFIFCFSSA
jgi:hypothetical protein